MASENISISKYQRLMTRKNSLHTERQIDVLLRPEISRVTQQECPLESESEYCGWKYASVSSFVALKSLMLQLS